MSEHDIVIMWGNKPTYNRHKVAIEIQDACNLRAVARELVKVADAADAEGTGTESVWRDPAVVIVVNRLESLVQSEHNFSKAYQACKQRS